MSSEEVEWILTDDRINNFMDCLIKSPDEELIIDLYVQLNNHLKSLVRIIGETRVKLYKTNENDYLDIVFTSADIPGVVLPMVVSVMNQFDQYHRQDGREPGYHSRVFENDACTITAIDKEEIDTILRSKVSPK